MEISEMRKKDFRTFFAAGYIKTKEKPTTHPLLRKKKNNWIMSLFTLQVQFSNQNIKFNTKNLSKNKENS